MRTGEGSDRSIELEQIPTGVAGLDVVLRGGLVKGGAYLVLGKPGAGKTTLGNQIAYTYARDRETVVFATLLAESHGRMIAHLSGFDFFNRTVVGRRVHYVSLFDDLAEHGFDGVLATLRKMVRETRATLVVIDGSALFSDFAASRVAYRQFVSQMHILLATLNCTLLLLSDDVQDDGLNDASSLIGTHVDGLLSLVQREFAPRSMRYLQVLKMRGVPFLEGLHQMRITRRGVEIYPRLEAQPLDSPPGITTPGGRLAIGVAGLDAMLSGGLLTGSTTLLLGAPGASKTLLGLHFLAEGARLGEPGLFVGFHESPARLISKAESIGLDLARYVDQGLVRIVWNPPLELLLDEMAGRILGIVQEYRPKRMMLDALTDLERMAMYPQRLPAFLAALTNHLRAADVTMMMSAETEAIVGPDLRVPVPAASAIVENIILLRYVELSSQLRRMISVLKVREGMFDSSIREFRVADEGIEVAGVFEHAEAVLTGVARRAMLDFFTERSIGSVEPERS